LQAVGEGRIWRQDAARNSRWDAGGTT
jgi:hypothetical protein